MSVTESTKLENIFIDSSESQLHTLITFSLSPLRMFTISVFILFILLVIYWWSFGIDFHSMKETWDQWVGKWVLYTYVKDGAIQTTRPNPNSYLNTLYEYIYPINK